MDNVKDKKVARRSFLKGAATLAGIAVVPMLAISQQAHAAKVPKAAMQYQDHPKGPAECSNCTLFIPGKTAKAMGTCQVVEGEISPHGWCTAYTHKA